MTERGDLLELDLRPLPTLDGDGVLSDDALLGQALHDLYPPEPATLSENTWESLAPVAREEASRRRRKFLAGRLAVAMGPQRILAIAAVVLVLVGASLAVGRLLGQSTSVHVLTAPHATVLGTGTNPQRETLLNGAVIDVRGEVAVDQSNPNGAQIQLHTGMVHASVPRLPQNHPFVVMTPHAEVTVHGTKFTVEQSPEGNTSVSVEEGLVAVRPLDGHRPTMYVRPGESVTVVPFSTYFAQLEKEVTEAATKGDSGCNDPQDLVAKYIDAAPPSSDVSVAHYLLGVCAVKKGDRASAIDQFELAAQSPARERADNALARAAQLRMERGAKDGRDAWARYLKRFPNGLHTDLARQSLGESPEGSTGP